MHVTDALLNHVVIGHNVTVAAYDKSRTRYIDEFFRSGRSFGSCHIRLARRSCDGRFWLSNRKITRGSNTVSIDPVDAGCNHRHKLADHCQFEVDWTLTTSCHHEARFAHDVQSGVGQDSRYEFFMRGRCKNAKLRMAVEREVD